MPNVTKGHFYATKEARQNGMSFEPEISLNKTHEWITWSAFYIVSGTEDCFASISFMAKLLYNVSTVYLVIYML